MRRRRLDEIFDLAALVLRDHLRLFLLVCVPPIVVFTAANTTIVLWLGRNGGDELEWSSWEHLGLLFLIFFERSLLALPLLLLNGNLLFDQHPKLSTIFVSSLRIYPRYLWSRAVVLPVQTVLLAWTFVIPWRALVTHFFKSEVIVLERLRGAAMSKRLSAIATGQGERNVGFLIMDLSVFVLFLSAVGFGFNVLLEMLSLNDRYWWLDARFSLFSPVMHFFIFVYSVYHTAAKFLYYIDSRSLREGWDIELTLVKGIRETEELA